MATSCCVSELLCYFMNKFGKTPFEKVKNVIVSFYDPDEIVLAKEILHAEVLKLNLDEAPRLKRRLGDNKSCRDADDIADLIQKCDEAGVLSLLPTFVAADLSRVPAVKAEELDICLLLRKINVLEATVQKHDDMLHKAHQSLNCNTTIGVRRDQQRSDLNSIPTSDNYGDADKQTGDVIDDQVNQSWANVANYNKESWNTVTYHKQKRQNVSTNITVRWGTKRTDDSSSTVKAVPKRVTACVSRLDIDTTSEDLHDFLTAAGMKNVQCTKLQPKNGKVFKTAAFKVSCSEDSQDVFYDENMWPDGCLLRDWVFRYPATNEPKRAKPADPNNGAS